MDTYFVKVGLLGLSDSAVTKITDSNDKVNRKNVIYETKRDTRVPGMVSEESPVPY